MNRSQPISLDVRIEHWPIAGGFTISRGAKTQAAVVVAELSDGHHRGRGECVPYARYGETVDGVADARARIRAVRRAAPDAELIVDANEGWPADNLADNLAACAQAGVTLVEQPLPADSDDVLSRIARPLPVCADESVHARASLPG